MLRDTIELPRFRASDFRSDPSAALLCLTGVRSAIPTATQRLLRPLGRVLLLLLLACFSLGLEEAEQEWGGLQGTKSGPESNRRGRINRASSAALHLHRAGGDMDGVGDAWVVETASFDLPGRDLPLAPGTAGATAHSAEGPCPFFAVLKESV